MNPHTHTCTPNSGKSKWYTYLHGFIKLFSHFSTDSSFVTYNQQKPRSFQCKTLTDILLCMLSWSRNNSAPRNDRAGRSPASHSNKYFWKSKYAEVERVALESEERFCYVWRSRDCASFKDRSFHAMAVISNDSHSLLLCPRESSSFMVFSKVHPCGGCYQFTAQTSLVFTLQT